MWPWIEDQEDDTVLLAKAERLAAAPRRNPQQSATEWDRESIDPSTAPLLAQRLCVEEIPLAPGCNSAAYVGWLGEDMGQTTHISDARATLRANAYRDWLWFGTHRPLTSVQRQIVSLTSEWPTRLGAHHHFAEIVEDVAAERDVSRHRAFASRAFRDLDGQPGPAPTAELWAARLARGASAGHVLPNGAIHWGSRGI